MSTAASTSASARRRSRQRADAREAILEATEALLVEEGFEAFSMRRLAARCGYTAPTIYHHFGDKRGLIDALLEERVRPLLGRLRRVRRGGDPAETLRAVAEAVVRFGLQYPVHYQLLTAPRPDDVAPPPAADAARMLYEDSIRELAESGRLVAGDTEEAAQCVWALIHGLISTHASRPDVAWRRSRVRTAIGALLAGLLRPAPARRGNGRNGGSAS